MAIRRTKAAQTPTMREREQDKVVGRVARKLLTGKARARVRNPDGKIVVRPANLSDVPPGLKDKVQRRMRELGPKGGPSRG